MYSKGRVSRWLRMFAGVSTAAVIAMMHRSKAVQAAARDLAGLVTRKLFTRQADACLHEPNSLGHTNSHCWQL
jgi:hypothetical protein